MTLERQPRSSAPIPDGNAVSSLEPDDKAVVASLKQVWAVTGYEDAVRLASGLGPGALQQLLDHERRNSDRPRYMLMLRRRLDEAVTRDRE